MACGDDRGRPMLTPQLAGVLGWFPADTETLHVAQSFQIPAVEDDPSSTPPVGDFRYASQLFVLDGLWGLERGKYQKPLVGRKVVAALCGSRYYDLVSKFGSLRSEGCSVLMFNQDLDDGGKDWTGLLRAGARQINRINGHEVFVFPSTVVMEGRFKLKPWQGTFLVLLTPKIVLCATSDTYLEEVLNRLDSAPKDRALPDSLPEWQHVDIKAPGWMLRHVPEKLSRRTLVGVTITMTERSCRIVYLPVGKSELDPQTYVRNRWFGKDPIIGVPTPYQFSRTKDGSIVVEVESKDVAPNGPLEWMGIYGATGAN